MISREKNKISYLHFILAILVVLIHSINNNSVFENVFSIEGGIGQFAVPLFFMLSGFLFFQNVSRIDEVPVKIKGRIKTVLYPYMIWNFIYYLIHHIIKPTIFFSITELFDAVFSYTYNPAFWFMFQLILLIAITPIIFYATKKIYYFIIFFIAISLFIIFNFDIPFINEDAIIYFSTGAFFAKLYKENLCFLIEKKSTIYAFLIAIFCFLINRIAFAYANMHLSYVPVFTLSIVYVRLSVAFFIFFLCDIFFKYTSVPSFMNHTFFLYGIHYMIVKGLIIVMNFVKYKFLEPEFWTPVEIAVFVISPVICVVINHYFSNVLIKHVPKFYALLTGDRK